LLDKLLIPVFLPLMFLTISVHEFSHGYVAYRMGDTTAKRRGRLTLNPLKHISLKYTILLPLVMFAIFRFGFALAKPVPINPLNFKNPKRGLIWIGLSGPVVNLFMAALLWIILWSGIIPSWEAGRGWLFVRELMVLLIMVNLALGIFNLLPIPPLDGSRVLVGVLPRRQARFILKYERVGLVVLFAVMMSLGIGLGKERLLPLAESLVKFLRLDQFVPTLI